MLAVVIDVFEKRGPKRRVFAPDFQESELREGEEAAPSYATFFEALIEGLPRLMRGRGRPLDALITPYDTWTEGAGRESMKNKAQPPGPLRTDPPVG
jgi:hypothetical protein